ncbi:hypothetical protein D3C86_1784650 [compost metagenome]
MFFPIILHFLTAQHLVGGRINGNQFTVRIGAVQAFGLRIQRQTGAEGACVLDGFFQFQRFAINYPDNALFTDTGDIHGVGGVISHQFARLQRLHGVTTFAIVQYQAPFHVAGFGVDGGHGAVGGVTEPQGLRGAIDGRSERF